MPRPDKPINSGGRLDGPASSSRGTTWTKHGGPEGLEGFRGAPSSIEVTVDDITIVEEPEAPTTDEAPVGDAEPTAPLSKWDQRGTAAHIPVEDPVPAAEPVMEWVVLRTIEDRTYHRTDALTEVPAGTEH